MRRLLSALLIFCLPLAALAQLSIADIFSDHMVLQRNKTVPVWGKASPGLPVTVQFAGQSKSTTTGNDGKWMIELSPLTVSSTPATLTVSTANQSLILRDILVGDIWLCTGQSNMEYTFDRSLKRYAPPGKGPDVAAAEVKSTDKLSSVRYIYMERILNKFPALPTKGWFNATDTTLRYVSAIGYFFAKEIFLQTGVPIGIISSSWGGTRIEQWTAPEAYKRSSVLSKQMTSDTFRIDGMKPGQMYKGMIAPFAGLAIKGVCWYQGESNCMIEDQDTYKEKMMVFEDSWREAFKDDNLPFYTVQIAPYLYSARKDPKPHSPELLARFWEAQARCLKLHRTYMVVTTDLVDNLKDIHPSYKWIIGQRMAAQALVTEYGKSELEAFHPAFSKMKRKGRKIFVSFSNTGGVLRTADAKPADWFMIAGKDKKFVPANVKVSGDALIITADKLKKPKYIRFAWQETAMPNLVNAAGLPAIPFRTDK